MFGPRPAALAVLFYISVPSFEFNIPTQQDFAVTFFVLAFAALAFLATENSLSSNLTMLRVGVIVAVAMVVISHHVSTYILLAFLGLLAVLPWILHRKDPYPTMRSLAVFFGALATAIVWVAAVSFPVLEAQKDLLANNLNDLVHPSQAPASAALLGATFPLYQVGWIVLSVVLVGLFAILVLAESYPRPERAFVTFSVLAALVVAGPVDPVLLHGVQRAHPPRVRVYGCYPRSGRGMVGDHSTGRRDRGPVAAAHPHQQSPCCTP